MITVLDPLPTDYPGELTYDVLGTDDDAEVQAALRLVAPATLGNLPLDSIRCEPLGGRTWKAVATYRPLEAN
jgi:hypothetical protein